MTWEFVISDAPAGHLSRNSSQKNKGDVSYQDTASNLMASDQLRITEAS
jgi:hypothetical protein